MSFVKLDTGILNSTLWMDRAAREVFITALLMAEPRQFTEPQPQISVRSLDHTDFAAPPGWYGFVEAAGVGIVRRAGLEVDEGMAALERLCSRDAESRSGEYDGRRMIRVNGGYLILNFMRYRDYDHGAAERMKLLRARRRAEAGGGTPPNSGAVTANSSNTTATPRKDDALDASSDAAVTPNSSAVTPNKPDVQANNSPATADSDAVTPNSDGGRGQRQSTDLNPKNPPSLRSGGPGGVSADAPLNGKSPKPRPSRKCPEAFAITPQLRQLEAELPDDFDLDGETSKFRDHEFRVAHSDWPATWRKWMRTARDDKRYAKKRVQRWE